MQARTAAERTASLYQRVHRFIPAGRIVGGQVRFKGRDLLALSEEEIATLSDEVRALAAERDAVILAHNYQTPEIFHCVADIAGDSLALAREAMKVEADVIVLAGVHFMAETAKLLNPEKTVLIPDLEAGCSLASSITATARSSTALRISSSIGALPLREEMTPSGSRTIS